MRYWRPWGATADPSQVWPGSQAIAKSKAYTANAFSLDDFALSTARLYTFTQPGHSLWSLGQSNLFDPKFLAPPSGQGGGKQQITGGLIFFGGGVPLYHGGAIVGGAIASSRPAYGAPAPVYVEEAPYPACRMVRERFWDGYEWRFRRIEVCN